MEYNINLNTILKFELLGQTFQYCTIAKFCPITEVYGCLKDIVFRKHIIHVPHLYFRAKIDNGIKSVYA